MQNSQKGAQTAQKYCVIGAKTAERATKKRVLSW